MDAETIRTIVQEEIQAALADHGVGVRDDLRKLQKSVLLTLDEQNRRLDVAFDHAVGRIVDHAGDVADIIIGLISR